MSSTFVSDVMVKARDLGKSHGSSRGSWVIDGNSSKTFCQSIIDGYEQNDPEIMDMSGSPLSGEFADDPTVSDVLQALEIQIQGGCLVCQEEQTQITDAYEHGYQDGFWDTVIQDAYRTHGEYDPCGVCGVYGHKSKDHDN